MDRRLGGALLLVLALLAALVVPGVAGRRTSGLATRVPVPLAPGVGQCLTAGLPEQANLEGWSIVLSEFEPCGAETRGEVVAVMPIKLSDFPPLEDSISTDTPEFTAADAQFQSCYELVAKFAGLEPDPTGLALPGVADGEVGWRPAVNLGMTLVGPSRNAQAAGAEWVVCATEVYFADSYRGTVRDAFTSGSLPEEFGLCWPSETTGYEPVPCSEGFQTQQLGWADLSNQTQPANDETLRRTCLTLAAELIDVVDPTFGGILNLSTIRRDEGYGEWVECSIHAPERRELNRSLIGIGDGPLPWVS